MERAFQTASAGTAEAAEALCLQLADDAAREASDICGERLSVLMRSPNMP